LRRSGPVPGYSRSVSRRPGGPAPLPRRELRPVGEAPMGLGPSLSIRQSQQLVLTPQLTQAIKLLQLSNLELDAFIAEELSKNPLLESPSADDEGEAPAADAANDVADSGEPADDPGADDLISGQADDDRPLDVDWTSEALETDSFADVVTSSSG